MNSNPVCASRPSVPRVRYGALFTTIAASLLVASAAGAGDLENIKARGKIVMLTFPAIEDPFVAVDVEAMRTLGLKLTGMTDPQHFHGVDVEIIKGFALKLGVKLEMHPETAGYGSLLPALLKGTGDLVASRLTITPKRQEAADFSMAYFTQWVVAAVRPDSPLKSVGDLKGKTVAVMTGSSQQEFLPALNLDPKIHPTTFNQESYTAVIEGEADYALMDSRAAVGEPVSAAFNGLKVGLHLRPSDQGIMLRKGSNLKAPLDAYIEDLRASGELVKILEKHGLAKASAK